jgi:hypothetical protein
MLERQIEIVNSFEICDFETEILKLPIAENG